MRGILGNQVRGSHHQRLGRVAYLRNAAETAFTKLKAANTFSAALDKESQEVKMEVDAAQQQAKDEHVTVSGLA